MNVRRLLEIVTRNVVGFYDRSRIDFLVNIVGRSYLTPRKLRYFAYRRAGIRVNGAEVRSGCTIRGTKLIVHEEAMINHNVLIDCREQVEIGQNTYIAFDVLICTSTHKIGSPKRRAGEPLAHPVTIGKGCWIGARASILPGVTVGDGCIIAAGALVNKDCKPHRMYAGVPAKEIARLDET